MSDERPPSSGGPDEVAPVRRRRDRPERAGASGGGPAVSGEEYVPMPRHTSGGRRVLAVFAAVLAAVGLSLAAGVFWISRQIDPPGEQGADPIEVVIPAGTSRDGIADVLADKGVISAPSVFRSYVQFKQGGPWQAGKYTEFRANSSYSEAIEVLDEGPVPPDANIVRIPEGTILVNAIDIIAKSVPGVSAADLVEALGSGEIVSKYKPADVNNWEGFLFPDTYQFGEGATAKEILQTMATRNDEVLDSLDYDRAEALQGRSPYELVIVASLIEREAGRPPEERGKIARVIFNRLDANEILGIDASNLYGLGRTSGELTKSDLEVDSPYNLRKRQGLPPTPICMPGKDSLEAAIRAPEGNWRYYVLTSNDPPSHFFTDSQQEFDAAVKDSRERGVF